MLERQIKIGIFLVLCASGCAPALSDNPVREPNRVLPGAFPATSVTGEGATDTVSPEGAAGANAAQTHFRAFFQSPELQALIDAALQNNQELNVRLQEIVVARAEVSAKRGEYSPKVEAVAGLGVEKVGDSTSQGISDKAHGLPGNLGKFDFGLRASWELDVWGKLRNSANAANLRYLSTIEGKNFFVTQLVAEIARSYFDLVALDAELEVLHRNIAIQGDALEVVKAEKQAARVTELAVQRFEAEVLKNKSRLYDLEQERVQVENRINFLVGRFPQPVARNARAIQEPLPALLAAGLPSQLLDNRPDVRHAELELDAAKLDTRAAKANFYPSLHIDAALGYQSFNLSHLLKTPESVFYDLAGGLTAPLLNRKGIEAQYRSANARQLAAVFTYERTLLQAFTDVANQLVVLENLQKSYDLRKKQVDTLQRSVEVSTVLFQSARADYMEVLLTRRDSLDAELETIETKKRLLQSLVNLYQALGGGWRPPGRR
jgi:NodT family efflux transporter outer membrane factor (OMF) lipoprotein